MTVERLRPHRRWLALFAAALVLLLAGSPLARQGLEIEQRRAEDIAAERAKLQETARSFQDDILLARKLESQMNAEDIDRLLAPVDRLGVAAELERQAASSRFEHFAYTIAPEKKTITGAPGAEGMAESDVTLAADMPLDTDAYIFIDRVRALLPGRARLKHLTLTRLAADAPLALDNIHMEAALEWLSNGAAKNGQGGL
jgi:hypothetical protein